MVNNNRGKRYCPHERYLENLYKGLGDSLAATQALLGDKAPNEADIERYKEAVLQEVRPPPALMQEDPDHNKGRK